MRFDQKGSVTDCDRFCFTDYHLYKEVAAQITPADHLFFLTSLILNLLSYTTQLITLF